MFVVFKTWPPSSKSKKSIWKSFDNLKIPRDAETHSLPSLPFINWFTRKPFVAINSAFFISKNPFDKETIGNIFNKKSSLSLFNIKSIKRKPIRGSKYEVLGKRMGITSGVSNYVYSIYFDDNNTGGGSGEELAQTLEKVVSQLEIISTTLHVLE